MLRHWNNELRISKSLQDSDLRKIGDILLPEVEKSLDLIGTATSGPHAGTAGYQKWLDAFRAWLRSQGKGSEDTPEARKKFRMYKLAGSLQKKGYSPDQIRQYMERYAEKEKHGRKEISPEEREKIPERKKQALAQTEAQAKKKEVVDWVESKFPGNKYYGLLLAHSFMPELKNDDKLTELLISGLNKLDKSDTLQRTRLVSEILSESRGNRHDTDIDVPKELIRRAKKNDSEAMQVIADLMGPMMLKQAKKVSRDNPQEIEDRLGDAKEILFNLVAKYNPEKGHFSHYLAATLSRELAKEAQHVKEEYHVSQHHRTLRRKVRNLIQQEPDLSVKEIFDKLKVPGTEKIRLASNYYMKFPIFKTFMAAMEEAKSPISISSARESAEEDEAIDPEEMIPSKYREDPDAKEFAEKIGRKLDTIYDPGEIFLLSLAAKKKNLSVLAKEIDPEVEDTLKKQYERYVKENREIHDKNFYISIIENKKINPQLLKESIESAKTRGQKLLNDLYTEYSEVVSDIDADMDNMRLAVIKQAKKYLKRL